MAEIRTSIGVARRSGDNCLPCPQRGFLRRISPETRDKVRRISEQLGYGPTASSARPFAPSCACWVWSARKSPLCHGGLGAGTRLRSPGYNLMIINTLAQPASNPGRPTSRPSWNRVDGILYATMPPRQRGAAGLTPRQRSLRSWWVSVAAGGSITAVIPD